ncbi:MAG: dephospho-CoA kinase [Rhodanobacteraceae bacterium]|jgi:dephospho-CoA kinase|nr:dephospho-CoA kinase [Rhodanobacteraceae bacterium]MBL0042611.1 dephospho-CoA kinase [Xanthomonadales bacterium]MBP6078731.1 dephospho-CoA kinase [Xanthomonadales bacterium]MBP7624539.1 dephospho-CoA kinase [Xanthomonadales bacterium]
MAAYAIALSGGIASGKTAVTERLQELGAQILDADQISREVVAPGTSGLKEITTRFGPSVLLADGSLDRRAMREHIFASADERRALEAIVHPRVREALKRGASDRNGIVVLAIPLLVESGHYDWVDRTVMVDARTATQQARLMQRDKVDAALALNMIAAQAPRSRRLAIADEVLANDGTLAELQSRVDAAWVDWQAALTRKH